MSFDVELTDHSLPPWCSFERSNFVPEYDGDVPCTVPCYPSHRTEAFEDGGTYVLGGSTNCDLNITYNYSRFFYRALDAEEGLRWLHNKTAADTVERLEQAVHELGTIRDEDYWKPTEGNAGAALVRLLAWARAHPTGIWGVH